MKRIVAVCAFIGLVATTTIVASGNAASDDSMSMEKMVAQMQEMNEHVAQMLKQPDPNFDVHFIDLMIPHHEGAIAMAKHALSQAKHPELKKMAEEMISSQQKEIDQLKQWRKTW